MSSSFVDPRRVLRKSEVLTNLHHYRNDMFIEILERQVQELNDRFGEIGIELLFGMSCLDPQNLFSAFDKERLVNFAKLYPVEFSLVYIMELKWALPTYFQDVTHDERFFNLDGIAELGRKMVEKKKHLIHPLVYLLIKLGMFFHGCKSRSGKGIFCYEYCQDSVS
ncbi:uncharacterized protein LOC141660547 [Apium graveolens]|uniref:uncharacterized protein LOC141660547 n=1 Tax=Apium graveolens TaxID=4045 RepID=UPI003D793D48